MTQVVLTKQGKIKGAARVDRFLREFGDVGQEIIREVMAESTAIAGKEMKSRAPFKTGTLRDSIQGDRVKQTNTGVVDQVGPTVPYAVPVEFGTRRQVAQPFMRSLFDSRNRAWQARIGRRVRIKVIKEARRRGRL